MKIKQVYNSTQKVYFFGKLFGIIKLRQAAIWCLTLLLTLVASAPGLADSLWSEQSDSLYMPKPHSFHAGDLLMISIVDQAGIFQTDDATNKDGNNKDGGKELADGLLPPQTDAGGDPQSEMTIKARMTVTVTEVMPNGILKLEGTQQFKVNKENQSIKISGTARAGDVSADNMILSTCIANTKIEYEGAGGTIEKQGPGILTKLFKWLF